MKQKFIKNYCEKLFNFLKLIIMSFYFLVFFTYNDTLHLMLYVSYIVLRINISNYNADSLKSYN